MLETSATVRSVTLKLFISVSVKNKNRKNTIHEDNKKSSTSDDIARPVFPKAKSVEFSFATFPKTTVKTINITTVKPKTKNIFAM